MKNVIVLTFLMLAISTAAQDTLRLELPQRLNDPQPIVVPAGTYGIVLLEHKREMPPGVLTLVNYDTLLEKKWELELAYSKKFDLVEHKVEGHFLYLVFNDEDEPLIEVGVVDILEGVVKTYQFPYFDRFKIEKICVKDDELFVAGLLRKLPAAVRLNFNEFSVESLPMAINGKRVAIEDLFCF